MASIETAIGVNTGLMALGIATKQKALTNEGLAHAWLLGVILLSSFVGWQGYTTCVLYLILGTLVTKIRQKEKEDEGIAEKRGGARGPENVWGSALTAAVCALLGTTGLDKTYLSVAFVASLAAKLSDTTQSEIGKAFGKRTFLITTLKPVPRGTEGAVSLEGTVAGVVASLFLPLYATFIGFLQPSHIPICILCAFFATFAESLLGATVQGRLPILSNEVINFIMTLLAALFAIPLLAVSRLL